ncbi:hypothetical protein SKAU_G00212980 [Synaphobranchus kaupii]|uniref:Uncharacterized protein n=1 Tax=Synaphobranchus kaupii TaxID=118154 RepID=A0A9Q1IV43_SYNKA|nr:hypothetical protein SKAU_G00212980 [Synaphobranchus kaupii]
MERRPAAQGGTGLGYPFLIFHFSTFLAAAIVTCRGGAVCPGSKYRLAGPARQGSRPSLQQRIRSSKIPQLPLQALSGWGYQRARERAHRPFSSQADGNEERQGLGVPSEDRGRQQCCLNQEQRAVTVLH